MQYTVISGFVAQRVRNIEARQMTDTLQPVPSARVLPAMQMSRRTAVQAWSNEPLVIQRKEKAPVTRMMRRALFEARTLPEAGHGGVFVPRKDKAPVTRLMKRTTMPNRRRVAVDCAICHECNNTTLATTNCGHVFCNECLQMWIRKNHDCPTCRRPVDMVISLFGV
jgi:hypothetical protein